MKKRILCTILSLAMMVSLLCTATLPMTAEEEEIPETIGEAFTRRGGNYMPNLEDLNVRELTGGPAAGTITPDHKINIDGVFSEDDDWGTPVFSFSGEDAYWFARAGIEMSEVIFPMYDSWARTYRELVYKNDGSVEVIRGMTFTGYARWDVKYLYLCFVIEGQNQFYANDTSQETAWAGNGVQVSFGVTKDAEGNFPIGTEQMGDGYETDEFNDPSHYKQATLKGYDDNGEPIYNGGGADLDRDGRYETSGYVGNEYLFCIEGVGPVEEDFYEYDGLLGNMVTQGTYNNLPQSTLRGLNVKNSTSGVISARGAAGWDYTEYLVDENGEVLEDENGYPIVDPSYKGLQVYEIALEWDKIGVSAARNFDVEVGMEVPFAVAYNINISDTLSEEAFNGFQLGCGIFLQNKSNLWNSMRLVLVEEDAHVHNWVGPNCSEVRHCSGCGEVWVGACMIPLTTLDPSKYENHTFGRNGACTGCDKTVWDYIEEPELQYVVGDINGDGSVDEVDDAYLTRKLANIEITGTFDEYAACIVGGETYDDVDNMVLARYLAGWDVDSDILLIKDYPVVE